MFRNFLDGNRDLYVASSSNGGRSFENAQKLGDGNWKLNGCPMDGGGLTINDKGVVETVWQRKGIIYANEPGKEEMAIGEGKGCTLASLGNKNVYAWVEKGKVVCLLPNGQKQIIGEGNLPVVKFLNEKEVICIWQQKDCIARAIINL